MSTQDIAKLATSNTKNLLHFFVGRFDIPLFYINIQENELRFLTFDSQIGPVLEMVYKNKTKVN